jgi:hypothetical protein
MYLTKKHIRHLEGIQQSLNAVVRYMSQKDVQGIAHMIPEAHANGGDYKINNPKFIEVCGNLMSENIRIHSHGVGSDFVRIWTAKQGLDSFLEQIKGS